MGSISVLSNEPVLIDFPSDYVDSGWEVVGGKAHHTGCNAGYISNTGMNLTVGQYYMVSFFVENRTSGMVRALLGDTLGAEVDSNGQHVQILQATGNGSFRFYSDGNLTVSLLDVSKYTEEDENGVTLAFSEDGNLFATYYSFLPEMMVKFIDGFFAFKNGVLWEQNVNPIRNNFFGTQYKSKIIYYVNLDAENIKTFYNIRLNGNKAWAMTEAYIFPTEGKSEGMRTYLPKKRFENYQGNWFADFLRNVDDPRFTDDLKALFNGAPMQGGVMRITLENDDITEVRLSSVEVSVATQNFT